MCRNGEFYKTINNLGIKIMDKKETKKELEKSQTFVIPDSYDKKPIDYYKKPIKYYKDPIKYEK